MNGNVFDQTLAAPPEEVEPYLPHDRDLRRVRAAMFLMAAPAVIDNGLVYDPTNGTCPFAQVVTGQTVTNGPLGTGVTKWFLFNGLVPGSYTVTLTGDTTNTVVCFVGSSCAALGAGASVNPTTSVTVATVAYVEVTGTGGVSNFTVTFTPGS